MLHKNSALLAILLVTATTAQWHFSNLRNPLAWTHPQTRFQPNSASPWSHPQQALVAPISTSSQFHAQDELGQASFGYSHPGQSSVTHRDAFGNQVGSYQYVNPEGKLIRVDYIADSLGFRVASNALPVAPGVPTAVLPVGPAPVEDTPEVKKARAEHLAAVAEAKSRSRRSLLATPFSFPTFVHAPSTFRSPLSFVTSPLTHFRVAAPVPVAAPIATVVPVPISSSSKYHVQTELGEAQFGHAAPGQAHHAVRDVLGNVHGSYAYVNNEGRLVDVQYSNGINGFLGATRWSID